MEWLKELLKDIKNADELQKAIAKGIGENFVPKSDFNNVNEAKKGLETQLNTANTTIVDLKKENKDNEELQGKIKQYETDLETLKIDSETKIKNLTLDNAIKLALKDNKAKFEDLLIGKVDRETLTIKEDGTVEGLEEQINGLKETYKDLFVEPIKGWTPDNKGQSDKGSTKRAELEAIINNPETKLAERIAAKNELFKLNESEE